jgi:hypothetical protein
MSVIDDDPVLGILLLHQPVKIPPSIIEQFAAIGVREFTFPEYCPTALHRLWATTPHDDSYTVILAYLDFRFEFRAEFLPIVIGTSSELDPGMLFRAKFVLYTYIAWHCNPSTAEVPILLDSLQ